MRGWAVVIGIAVSVALVSPGFAVGDVEPPEPLPFDYAVETLGEVQRLTISESGRYAAWQEQDRIRLLAGHTGETIDLPGPPLAPDGIGLNLRLNDKFVVWRAITGDTFERTPLLVYKINPRELVQAYDAAGINDAPVLLGGQLVWKGAGVDEPGFLATNIFVYDAWNDILEDLTPLSDRVEWLSGDGTTIAWTAGYTCCGRFTEVWAMDLRSRQRWLLDEGERSRHGVKVVSDTIHWQVGTDPVESSVAFLRRKGPCGELGPELALIAPAPALVWRRRQRQRRS